MRWSLPKVGDVRVERKFAWKPTKIGDEMVWLGFYEVRSRYRQFLDGAYWVRF